MTYKLNFDKELEQVIEIYTAIDLQVKKLEKLNKLLAEKVSPRCTCGCMDNRILDKRTKEAGLIRRKECKNCKRRYNTIELNL